LAAVLVATTSLILGLTTNAAPPEGKDRPAPQKRIKRTVDLQTNYWELYPRHEDVVLLAMDPLREGFGVQLSVGSSMKGVSHFIYSVNGAPAQRSDSGKISIRFEDKNAPAVQRTTTTIKAATTSGAESKSYPISINFYPRELYAASGQTAPGYMIIQQTDLALTTSRVEEWILHHPSPDEVAYARKTWGRLFSPGQSDYDNVCALARSIMDDLEPHRGIPSDEMGRLSAFDQYRRVMAGKDRLWCGNIAQIFASASNALGIPCRIIGMNRAGAAQPEGKGRPVLLLAEGHGSTEIYSERLKSWIWIDLTFCILGAYLREEGLINMAELYSYLNDPNRLPSLRLHVYDPRTRTARKVLALESEQKGALFNYFKRDQRFHYTRWDRE
jgi:hypothetical protein